MDTLQKYLLNGTWITVYSRQDFDDLVAACNKLGYGWRIWPQKYDACWQGVSVTLEGCWLVYSTYRHCNPFLDTIDWLSIKSGTNCPFVFTY